VEVQILSPAQGILVVDSLAFTVDCNPIATSSKRGAVMMSCPDCGENLDKVPKEDPCPSCGGSRRQAVVSPAPIEAVAVVESASYKITKGAAPRPWTEKWQMVLFRFEDLERCYAGESLRSSLEAETRANDFFIECDHLRDWLVNDHASVLGLTEGQIRAYVKSSPALQACYDICNTYKHHTRDHGTTARIKDVQIGLGSRWITYEIDWGAPNAWTVDALDLANECVTSWRDFLKTNGISEK
jgi:hypothetical protein